jgi:hypothetical protein
MLLNNWRCRSRFRYIKRKLKSLTVRSANPPHRVITSPFQSDALWIHASVKPVRGGPIVSAVSHIRDITGSILVSRIRSEVLVSFRHLLRNECPVDTLHSVTPCPVHDLPLCCSLIFLGTGVHVLSSLRKSGEIPPSPPVYDNGSDRDNFTSTVLAWDFCLWWRGETYTWVLMWNPEGKRQLGRPRLRWEDNIKMDI